MLVYTIEVSACLGVCQQLNEMRLITHQSLTRLAVGPNLANHLTCIGGVLTGVRDLATKRLCGIVDMWTS